MRVRDLEQKTKKTVEFSVGAKQTPGKSMPAIDKARSRLTHVCLGNEDCTDLATKSSLRVAQALKAESGPCCVVGIPAWEVGCARWAVRGGLKASVAREKFGSSKHTRGVTVRSTWAQLWQMLLQY